MVINTSLAYLVMAMGVILLLWIVTLMTLVFLLRRRLKAVTAERDYYAVRFENIAGFVGQEVRVKPGDKTGQSGVVLWALENEVCLQTDTDRIMVDITGVELVAPEEQENLL